MLWTIAVLLIIVWMLGLGSGSQTGLFIHVLYAAAVALLVVSVSREAAKGRILKRILRRHGQCRRVDGDM
ncbi:MAG: lmo0937 family membrane protein [Thermodesulfobacteriota bacterium]